MLERKQPVRQPETLAAARAQTREAFAGASCPPRVSGTTFRTKSTAATQTDEKKA